jgi:transposase
MNFIHSSHRDESGPSIPEMREMLSRPDYIDTYPHVERKPKACVRCGNAKPDYWIVIRKGKEEERFCSVCGAS